MFVAMHQERLHGCERPGLSENLVSSKEQTIVLSRGLGGVVGNFLGHYFACS